MTDTLRARLRAIECVIERLGVTPALPYDATLHAQIRIVRDAIAADEQAAQQEREPTPAPKLHDWYGPALKETTWGPTGWRCQCGRWYATEGFAKACGRPIPVAPDPVAEIIREHRSAGELASNVCYCGAILKRPTLGEADIAHVVHVAGLVREAIAREGK